MSVGTLPSAWAAGQEPVAGEALGQDQQEVGELGDRSQGGALLLDCKLDGLPVEDAVIAVGQVIHDPGVFRG
jgi:hypothetical protein